MEFTRRKVAQSMLIGGAALAAPTVFSRPLRAAEFAYKYANNSPATWPMNTRAKEAADKIREETHGRFSIEIFPNNQLGNDTDMLSQVRTGAIDFFTLSGVILATLVPVASISGVGFAFKNYDQVWAAMDGELGNHVRGVISKIGLVAMDKVLDNGFRHITTSTKPINTPADLTGFKMRVQVSPLSMATWKALGASPAGINWNEVYSALQTKIVDGQENPLSIIEASKIYEVQKYCSLTGHSWDGFHFLANKRSWEALPADVREIAARNLNAMALAQRADMLVANEASRGTIEKFGLKFNVADSQQFRAVLTKSGYYGDLRTQYGAEVWSMLEKVSGTLT